LKAKLEELLINVRNCDSVITKKDEEIYKLRQDNSQMFNDLKGLSNCED
jgi:hypothetical protein